MPMALTALPDLSRLNQETYSLGKGKAERIKEVRVIQCLPIYSILLASRRTNIDFFSLDIEGAELDVLKTIPWPKVDIKVILVEYAHIKEGKKALIDYMTSNGYTSLPNKGSWWQDIVFVKNGFKYNRTGFK